MPSAVDQHDPTLTLAQVDGAGCLRVAPPRPIRDMKAVVVQSGARDAYQLALALSERELLEMMVTDLFWPADRGWARTILAAVPGALRAMLLQRSEPRLPSDKIKLCWAVGLKTLLFERLSWISSDARRRATRYADSVLGHTAGTLAKHKGVGLVSYSYYGYAAFEAYGQSGMLFQLHPHPVSMRRILSEELAAHPDCASSLRLEWELSLPEEDFQHLVSETNMASAFLVASSFTKNTLVENGAPAAAVKVVPYGVDTVKFKPASQPRSNEGVLRLLFVGRINQRKGIKYLLEALQILDKREVELTVCGRVVDGLELFRPFADRVKVRPSVSAEELVAAYQTADLFVFPSVAEGFGQVLLEALACGLPILSTTHTAAPDLIDDGIQGFVVEPRRPDLIAERILWALEHRVELTIMGHAARARAELFTWERFRTNVADSVEEFLVQQSPPGLRAINV